MSVELYTVKVDCSFNGNIADVGSIKIRVAPSVIPSVVLTMSPFLSKAKTALKSVSAGIVLKTMSDAAKFIGKPANLLITVSPIASSGVEQKLALTNWRIKGVGLVNLSASGQLTVQVELEHPASSLDTGLPGAVFSVQDKDTYNPDGDAVNLLDAYTKALKEWGKRVENGQELDATHKLLLDRLNKGVDATQTYLEWGTYRHDPFPLASVLTNGKQFHLNRIYNNLKNSNGIGSVWEHISKLLLDEYQLSILPYYTSKKLKIGPFSPWGKPKYTVTADMIANIAVPAIDTAPLAGVRIMLSKFTSPASKGSYSDPQTEAAQRAELVGDTSSILTSAVLAAIYPIEDVIVLTKEDEGKIVTIECPSWLTPDSVKRNIDLDTKPGSDGKYAAVDENTEAGRAELENIEKKYAEYVKRAEILMGKAGYALGLAEILTLFRQSKEVVFNTCLNFNCDNELVVPGYRTVVKDESGNPAFSFYLGGLEHCIDVAGNSAYTAWHGSYIKMTDDPGADKVVSLPQENPLYEALKDKPK